jgi:hypothetical protein
MTESQSACHSTVFSQALGTAMVLTKLRPPHRQRPELKRGLVIILADWLKLHGARYIAYARWEGSGAEGMLVSQEESTRTSARKWDFDWPHEYHVHSATAVI